MAHRRSPWGECTRCGFKRRLPELVKEWTGLRVCKDTCRDPKPADMKPPKVKPEGQIVRNASPETTPVFAKYTNGDHLP